MESIEQMIKRLCPKGVEYVKLGEVCEIRRGIRVVKKQLGEEDGYPVFQNSLTSLGMYQSSNRKAGTTFIICAGAAGEIGYCNSEFWAADDCSTVESDVLIDRFIYFYLMTQQYKLKSQVRKASVPRLSREAIENLIIPLPPLEIQSRIVKVLDKMTTLTAELEAELEARKQQYEYYRNKLLTFSEIGEGNRQVTWKKISEICTNICSGGTPPRDKSDYFIGNIPWLRTQEVNWTEIYDTELKISEEAVKNSSAKIIPSNCVIVAMYGATAAKACINKIELTTNQACCNLQIDSGKALYKYVYYWICNNYIKLKCLGEGSQNNLNAKKIKDFIIPIPPLSEQQRIVSILDRFEALTTDLQSGLPAEIEARRQQYEYYRNKLLTFEAV